MQFPGYSGLTTIHILVTTIESTFGAPSDASLAHPGFEAREAKIYGSWKFVAINMTNMHWHWPLKIWPPMICPPILYLKLTTNAPYRIMKMLTMTWKRSPSHPNFTVQVQVYTLYVYSVYILCINCWAQWQLLDSGGMVDHKEIAGAWILISNILKTLLYWSNILKTLRYCSASDLTFWRKRNVKMRKLTLGPKARVLLPNSQLYNQTLHQS